jgi:hypothetical protein
MNPYFTEDQLELIYKAVRYYQMNGTVVSSQEYLRCSPVLDAAFPVVQQIKLRRDAVCDT